MTSTAVGPSGSSSTEPLVSVLLITYNQVDMVRTTVFSVMQQHYRNFELIISDDGSTDGTAEVIRSLAKTFPRHIKAIVDGPHVGITNNCNRGLRLCTGKYVAFLGGDDFFLPDKIRLQVDWLEKDDNRVFCSHDAEVIDWKTGDLLYRWQTRFPPMRGSGPSQLIREGCIVGATTVMVRSSSIPSIGFDQRLPFSSDWKLWIDVLAGGGEAGYIDRVLAKYGRHEKNVTVVKRRACLDDQRGALNLVQRQYPHLAPHCRFARLNRPSIRSTARIFTFDTRLWDSLMIVGIYDLLRPIIPLRMRTALKKTAAALLKQSSHH